MHGWARFQRARMAQSRHPELGEISEYCFYAVTLRFVDNRGAIASAYPYNPNGSSAGITGLTTTDGRFTVVMPHPERVFRTVQNSWHPREWGEDGPWMRIFRNASKWVASS